MRGVTIYFVETSANPYLKPHACSGIFEIQAVSRHCFVTCSFKVFWTKSGITSIWEVPKVYFLTCNMKLMMLNVCCGVQNLGEMRALAGCIIQNVLHSASTCKVAKIYASSMKHDGAIRNTMWMLVCEYFTCPLQQCSHTFSLQCLPKTAVLCSVTLCSVAGWALVGTGVCQETLYTCYKCT